MDVAPLFRDGDLSATLEAQLAKASRAVEEVPEAEFRNGDANVIAARVFQRFRVEPVSLTEGAISVQAEEADIDRRAVPGLDFGFPGDPPTIRGTRVMFNVPFVGAGAILRLRPSGWTTTIPYAAITASVLRFIYDVPSSQVANTKASFERDLSLTKQYLAWGGEDLTRFNSKLVAIVEGGINQRTSRLQAASEGLAALGLPLRRAEPIKLDAHLVRPPQGSSAKVGSEDLAFDVALSFAGEDRAYVQEVAQHLAAVGARVFYDEFQTVALWGKDLIEHLQDIYQNQARFCVLFISKHYVSKPWPTHERRSALARALVAKEEYLLPARFDDSTLPGLQPTVGYVDLRKVSSKEFATLVLAKTGISRADA